MMPMTWSRELTSAPTEEGTAKAEAPLPSTVGAADAKAGAPLLTPLADDAAAEASLLPAGTVVPTSDPPFGSRCELWESSSGHSAEWEDADVERGPTYLRELRPS